MKRVNRIYCDLSRLVVAGLAMIVIVSFLGRLTPAGDSLAVFRLEAGVLLVPASMVARLLGARRTPVIGAITAVIATLSVFRFADPGRVVDDPDIILHQHNVLYQNAQVENLVEELIAGDADVVTLQEVDDNNLDAIMTMSESFPQFQVCRYDRAGVAVYAREMGRPVSVGCAEKTELAWMRFETKNGPVTIASIHLRWPWPMAQFWQIELVRDEISQMPQPVVLAGDFNMVPWAAAMARLAEVIDGKVARGLEPTYRLGAVWPAFRIDNVIAPEAAALSAVVTEKWGSDHYGLTARISLVP